MITLYVTLSTAQVTNNKNIMLHDGRGIMKTVFEIKKNSVGRYYFVFRYENEEILLISGSYAKRSQLEKCFSDIREAAIVANICEKSTPDNYPAFIISEKERKYTFSLVGFGGNDIFCSEFYREKEKCLKVIKILKENCYDIGIIDLAR